MKKRSSIKTSSSKKLFSATAARTHRKNVPSGNTIMRGGIRL